MKKLISILLSSLLITSSFVACSSPEEESSILESSPSPEPSPSIKPEISDDSEESEDDIPDESLLMGTSFEDYVGSVREAYGEDYYPDTELSEDEITSEFNIDKNLYEEIWAEKTSDETKADVFVAVKTKEGKAEEVKEQLESYKQTMLSDTNFSEMSDKINASDIYTNGDYVFFMILGSDEFVDTGEDVMDGFINEAKKGIDALDKLFTKDT